VEIEKVGELFEAFEKLGAATGTQGRASELCSELRGKLDRLGALVGGDEKTKVLWVMGREPLRVAGRDTFVNEIIELAGGENAMGSTVHKYPPIGCAAAGRGSSILEQEDIQECAGRGRGEDLRDIGRYGLSVRASIVRGG